MHDSKPQQFIAAKNLEKHFTGVQALRDVSIGLYPGEIRCLAGENGSGKSTFIKIIAGVYKPDHGEIWINGNKVTHLRPIDAIHAGIQVIYQDFSLFPNLTVAENIALNTHLEQNRCLMNWRKTNQIAREALDRLGTGIDLQRHVIDISIAEKQLTAIAKALIQDAQLIIMDEPTTALTQKEIDVLFQIIQRLKQQGISILFVSHQLQEILDISEKITILRDGEKVAEGDTSQFDYQKLVFYMTGRELQKESFQFNKPNTKKVFHVENLNKKNTFHNINFDMYPGEIIGFTGLLGSGRMELARSFFGLKPADSGNIYIGEERVQLNNPQTAIDYGIAYVPEDRITQGLFLEQSVQRNTYISNLAEWTSRWGWILFKPIYTAVSKWLSELNIKVTSPHSPVQNLSGGNQQKVVLARWLSTRLKILILNGPTVGIDIGAKAEIHNKIKELARQGKAVIIITDDLAELIQTCNRIFLMHQGQIIEEFDAKDLDECQLSAKLSELS